MTSIYPKLDSAQLDIDTPIDDLSLVELRKKLEQVELQIFLL